MRKAETSGIQRYGTDKSGQFGVWFGILALPLLMATSFSVDFTNAQRSVTQIKAALDAAALASVINQNITDAERGAYATKHFNTNFTDAKNFKMTVVKSDSEYVELNAKGKIPVSISGALGFDGVNVNETSAAELTRENVICVMTLNPDGERSFEITDGSTFNSPACAVQVNSTHANAAVVDQASSATAKDFCVAGGASGAYSPYVNTECGVVADPYKDKVAPQPGTCRKVGKEFLNLLGEVVSEVTDNMAIFPGTYCDKIEIKGKNVTFMPGTFIMNNVELKFKEGAEATADGVTFVVSGEKGKIKVESGSSLYIKAPSTGDLAGLAIFQDTSVKSLGGKKDTGPKSELKGGSSMMIVGTVYLPTHELKVKSKSIYGNKAPATSFIAYNVAFEEDADVSVSVDHVAAGLPPILPRSDEGARLVK